MKYLFDMGEVWHVYSDVGRQWIYQRLERVSEEILEKNGDTLPGPLGKLDILKQLEGECDGLKKQLERKEQERKDAVLEMDRVREETKRTYEIAVEEAARIREQLELEVREAEMQAVTLQQELEKERIAAGEALRQEIERFSQEKNALLAQQREEFEKSYGELQSLAEELQKEGKLWRQRYLDLAYQVAPGKGGPV